MALRLSSSEKTLLDESSGALNVTMCSNRSLWFKVTIITYNHCHEHCYSRVDENSGSLDSTQITVFDLNETQCQEFTNTYDTCNSNSTQDFF